MLVGASTSDDAAVYKISEELALIQTVDFFTPIVDSPYAFGAISAANSISDVYAMGGVPMLAMNIVGFPRNHPDAPLSILQDILKGGADKAAEANISIVGGHTIDDAEPKYGMAVTGFVHPNRIWRNTGARPGDRLLLTKPLGMGIISTAMRAGAAPDALSEQAIELMCMLNRNAADAARGLDVHACTDITGFGLLGHMREMLGPDVDFELTLGSVPVIEGTHALAEAGFVPGGSRRNKASLASAVQFAPGIGEVDQDILCDAQTSGGLLFALPPDQVGDFLLACKASSTPAVDIGTVLPGSGLIRVLK